MPARTKDRGFDAVFGDSIDADHQYQPSVLVSGPPGAGKSLLAMSFSERSTQGGAAVVYVLTEERARDGKESASKLGLFANAKTHDDDDYASSLDLSDINLDGRGLALFTFYPELAFRAHAGKKPRFVTLYEHIQDRIAAVRSIGCEVKLVVVDSLFADP